MKNLKSYKGMKPQLGNRAYVEDSAVLYGDIKIDDDSSIWPLVAARGDVNHIRIGKRTNVQDGTVLHVTRKSEANPDGFPLIIGDDVTIGHNAMLHGCTLGSRILVGMSAVVMDGAIVGDDIIIGCRNVGTTKQNTGARFFICRKPNETSKTIKAVGVGFLKSISG